MNGVSGPDGEDYSPWADRKAAQPKTSSPPQSQSKLSDSYSNTLPVRKSVAPKNSYAASKGLDVPPAPGGRVTPRGGWGGPRAPSVCVLLGGTLTPFEISVLYPQASPGSPRLPLGLWRVAGCRGDTAGLQGRVEQPPPSSRGRHPTRPPAQGSVMSRRGSRDPGPELPTPAAAGLQPHVPLTLTSKGRAPTSPAPPPGQPS